MHQHSDGSELSRRHFVGAAALMLFYLGALLLSYADRGVTVALMVLWLLRVDVLPGLSFHLLGVTSLTLMFGWSLAIVSATVALAAVTLTVSGDWLAFSVNALVLPPRGIRSS